MYMNSCFLFFLIYIQVRDKVQYLSHKRKHSIFIYGNSFVVIIIYLIPFSECYLGGKNIKEKINSKSLKFPRGFIDISFKYKDRKKGILFVE